MTARYRVMAWHPDMRTMRMDYIRREKERHGVIVHYDRYEGMRDGDVRVRVLHPEEMTAIGYHTDIRMVSRAPFVELVEWPRGDLAALQRLRKQLDKDIEEARKEKRRREHG